ncbi:MAG: DUF1080 domain-containing protein [Lentisphaerae bacterium]|jgi:HEAT repeat protein|nr:DUF1080 domain-containing protein [Lentisphaerota bacterium]MBT4814610.1 DUF1080 domain-containing protein [Lentisphaerota bacterium]MBT5610123.1 DUF1080 domain-containing protein [Lentisphaerota bacterium]MBT7053585.1 DUF1080 domain-containing protein [Lentisphaerota bacterium]MBT7842111.1 DUF1080 domain-containing protein [Lentisphaerota bacterium]
MPILPLRPSYLPTLLLALAFSAHAVPPRATPPEATWRKLFNGTSLDGWVQRGGTAKYAVQDGAIVGLSVKGTPNSFLCTDRDYANFILEYEFKVHPTLNSGVQIRSNSLKEYRNGRVHGYQVEIDPGKRAWSGGIYDEGRRGWLYDLKNNEAARKAFKQGEWNHVRVEAIGSSIRTWQNGVSAADLTDDMTPTGFIALQVHATGSTTPLDVSWRGLRILDLGSRAGTTRDALGKPADTMGAPPPPGSLVLVGAKDDLSQWTGGGKTDAACPWRCSEGVLEIIPGKGSIVTRRSFRDFRMHVEFRVNSREKHSQNNGNSGVYIQRRYELQILNSHGQPLGNRECGALYKTKAPAVNACRKAPEWQTYDIVFRSPRWDKDGKKVENARITVAQNGALIHDNVDIPNKTGAGRQESPEDGPILLQDHGNPVHFRNTWIKELLTLNEAAAASEAAWEELRSHEYGQSRAPLLAIEADIRKVVGEERAAIEDKLCALLNDPGVTSDAKRFACRSLARIGTERAVSSLGKLVTDKALATEAQQALYAIPAKMANDALRAGLGTDAPSQVKAGIVNVLGRKRDASSLPELTSAFSAPDPVLAAAALVAVGRIGGPAAEEALETFVPTPPLSDARSRARLSCAVAAAAAKRDDAAIAICRDLIASAETDAIRLAACRELVRVQGTEALPQILPLLRSLRGDAQRIAARTVVDIPGKDVTTNVTTVLPELPPTVQAVIVRALADRGEEQAAALVTSLLDSRDEGVRLAAIDALAVLGGSSQVKPLTALALTKGTQADRAIHALAMLPGKGVDAAMLQTLEAAEVPALRRLLTRSLASRSYKPGVPVLLQVAASDADSAVRRECLKAIRALGSADLVPRLLDLMTASTQPRDIEEARRTIEALAQEIPAPKRDSLLLKAWDSAGEKGRPAVGTLLGTFGGDAAAKALITGLAQEDETVRYAAVKALGAWATPAPADALLAFAKITPNDVHHVLAIRGFVRLVGLITTGETKPKYEAALAIARRPQEKELLKSAMMDLRITGLKAGSNKPYEVIPKGFRLGEKPYIDREYTITKLPEPLVAADRIKTAMEDKYSKGDAFITFNINRPARVYVCYDNRAKKSPKWLKGWTRTKDAIASTDRACKLILYTKVWPAGKVVLGGNAAPGMGAMYIIGIAPVTGK